MKYQKQTTRNRCLILSANGIQKLIIPIKHSEKENDNLHDHNAKIDNSKNWKIKHWKSIQNAYRSSPFFEFYEEEFSNIFFNSKKLLYSSNILIISHISRVLGIKKDIKISNKKISHEKCDKRLINIKDYYHYDIPKYNQVFMSKFKFISNLSILDLLFNVGPESINYLSNLQLNQFHNN
tara:strand:- start:329 stop:868 length:540 start_codon:yes stop_codon:yes gene_type:complete